MLYCNKGCGSASDALPGCQKTDADAYCKLKLCDDHAISTGFNVATTTNHPGFACTGVGINYGNWMGIKKVYFDDDILSSHGDGEVVSNVTCRSKYDFLKRTN